VAAQLTGEQLRRLWRAEGHQFSGEAWGPIGEDFTVALRRCESCGFEYFDPTLAGNEDFYRQLEQKDYFSGVRPEFARTLAFAAQRGLKRVLDVGCGSGLFLDQARAAGLETSGLELNRAAADKARARGHRIFNCLLDGLDESAGRFSLVTAFQVLEHVPDPVGLLRQAAARLEPGGCISVAVPSAVGVYRLAPWDPSQWPPHHLTRWRPADLAQLARASGLNLVASGGDVLVGSAIEHFWRCHNRLAPALGRARRPGGAWLPRLLSQVYRKTGMKFLCRAWGESLYAYYHRPGQL
jgi:SAM-dependent methyltransferase